MSRSPEQRAISLEPFIPDAPRPISRTRSVVGSLAKWLGTAVLCRWWLSAVWVFGWLLRRAEDAAHAKLHALAGRDRPAPARAAWHVRLKDSAVLGVQGLGTTFLLAGPGMVLWWFGWRYGWDNSFLKGYESAAIGPLTGLLGSALFVAAMVVVPMGQARLAFTRNWRAAIDVSVLWRLVRRRWPAGVLLTGGYAAVGGPIMLMWMIVTFAAVNQPHMDAFTEAEAWAWLGRHYLFFALLLIPAFIALRRAAGRWYAAALVGAVQAGDVGHDALDPLEKAWLSDLGLLQLREHPDRHRLVRFAAWSATRLGRATGISAMGFLWFLVVMQVFVAQFFHYRSGAGWLLLPSITLPWFGSVPSI